jgi:hypothetical protein
VGAIRQVVAGEKVLVPEGHHVVLRVEESSFLGGRQAGKLPRVVEKLQERQKEAKLQPLGDIRQMQGVPPEYSSSTAI